MAMKWEYLRVEVYVHEEEAVLKRRGEEGWALVWMRSYGTQPPRMMFYFKRPKQ